MFMMLMSAWEATAHASFERLGSVPEVLHSALMLDGLVA